MAKQQFATYERLADFAPDWEVQPGQIIADRLEALGWTQRDLAVRTGYTHKHINLLINGKVGITEETAIKLEMVLGSSAQFWLNLESQCQEHIARVEAGMQLSQDVDWLTELPVADMKICLGSPSCRQNQDGERVLDLFGGDSGVGTCTQGVPCERCCLMTWHCARHRFGPASV